MEARWQSIRDILEKSLNPGLFKIWITPLTAEIDGTTCRLFAPNEFVASGVRDRLIDQIAEAARMALGDQAQVIVGSRPAHAAPANQSLASARTIPTPRIARAATQVPPQEVDAPSWRFSFDDFVVGPGNELAFAAAQGICSQALLSDQLFLSSGPGLGKTHLLQAIGRAMAVQSGRSFPRVRYLTAEEFATRMVVALKMREIDRFKSEFRQVDVLLLEDVHFLQGKQKIQDEMLSTLKALRERGSKVVFTSSFLPREISGVDSQLASRICSGFLAVIERPDLETRMRIVESKARSRFQINVPNDVSAILAQTVDSDIRQLESCLQNLIFKARLMNRHITTELAREVVVAYQSELPTPGICSIIQAVCRGFGLATTDLSSKSRKAKVVLARNTAFYLARKHTGLSLKDIGEHFNRRHSTVLKGITKLEREISQQTPLGRQVQRTMEFMEL